MSPWATFNVNRKKGARFWQIDDFQYRTGKKQPAAKSQPEPQTMRIAKKGERPPSRRPPGVPDQVIERFDAYMKAVQGGRVN